MMADASARMLGRATVWAMAKSGPRWKPTRNEVAASAATMVAKSDVSMHTANTGPARPEVIAGAHSSEAVGMDKGQISRALAGLASRKLVAKTANPGDSWEVLVSLTRTGLIAHETIVAGALERNSRLQEQFSKDEVSMLLGQIDRLTDTAAKMLEAEKDLG
jgi:DNA-binding MarR family transcriptional regulator